MFAHFSSEKSRDLRNKRLEREVVLNRNQEEHLITDKIYWQKVNAMTGY